MNRINRPTSAMPSRCRGAVMTEMVLVLPLVLLILALLVFLGRGHMRVQRAHVADRYVAWQETAYAGGPSRSGESETALNVTFFGGNAESLSLGRSGVFPTAATDRLEEYARAYSTEAGDLAQASVDALPAGISITVDVSYSSDVPLERGLIRSIRHRHTRMHTDWRAGNAVGSNPDFEWVAAGPGSNHNRANRDVFYDQIDQDLQNLPGDNRLADRVRGLYLDQPGYRGPWQREIYEFDGTP